MGPISLGVLGQKSLGLGVPSYAHPWFPSCYRVYNLTLKLYRWTPGKFISDETNFLSNHEDIFAIKYNDSCSSNFGVIHLFLNFRAVEDAEKLKTLSVQNILNKLNSKCKPLAEFGADSKFKF